MDTGTLVEQKRLKRKSSIRKQIILWSSIFISLLAGVVLVLWFLLPDFIGLPTTNNTTDESSLT